MAQKSSDHRIISACRELIVILLSSTVRYNFQPWVVLLYTVYLFHIPLSYADVVQVMYTLNIINEPSTHSAVPYCNVTE
jgi:hypothetical protein